MFHLGKTGIWLAASFGGLSNIQQVSGKKAGFLAQVEGGLRNLAQDVQLAMNPDPLEDDEALKDAKKRKKHMDILYEVPKDDDDHGKKKLGETIKGLEERIKTVATNIEKEKDEKKLAALKEYKGELEKRLTELKDKEGGWFWVIVVVVILLLIIIIIIVVCCCLKKKNKGKGEDTDKLMDDSDSEE